MKNTENNLGSQERFGYEWSKYRNIIPEYEMQFLKCVSPLTKISFKGKRILDAGCGIGRNSFWPLTYGAKEITAFDYDSRTVQSARENLRKFKNCQVLYNSIYDIKYDEEFDIALSIGVIHHLENPSLAVKKLTEAVKKGGTVVIWVYGYEGNEWIVKYVNPLRRITSRLPVPIVNLLSNFLSIPLFFYTRIINQRRPYMLQISRFKFWHIHSIVLDQLIPKIANYWKEEEVKNLFQKEKFSSLKTYKVNNNSWTVVGVKK